MIEVGESSGRHSVIKTPAAILSKPEGRARPALARPPADRDQRGDDEREGEPVAGNPAADGPGNRHSGGFWSGNIFFPGAWAADRPKENFSPERMAKRAWPKEDVRRRRRPSASVVADPVKLGYDVEFAEGLIPG
jgi:hypothetical protein